MPEEAELTELNAPMDAQGNQTHPLTVDELRPFFASMPSSLGELAHELALTRFRLAEARALNQQLQQQAPTPPRAVRRAPAATKRTNAKGTKR